MTCRHHHPLDGPCPACLRHLLAAGIPRYLAERTRLVANGHWRWVGSFNAVNRRPRCGFRWGDKNYTLAYQAFLVVVVGVPLPGMIAAHVCRERWCCRPVADHVIWACSGDNGHHERGHRPGRPRPAGTR